MFKYLIQTAIRIFGYKIVKYRSTAYPVEATEQDKIIESLVSPFTMTSSERVWSVINSINYIVGNNIVGDVVECGVWRGGSSMAAAYKLKDLSDFDRTIWLYDTFSGMTNPSHYDIESASGKSAVEILDETRKDSGNNVWCIASRQNVENNLQTTGYPLGKIKFIEGDILETLNTEIPSKIALLRLDTDWYESTKKELEILYPRLVKGGVCIIDDYGHWQGSKKAVDEYFADHNIKILMHPIDGTGRIFVKP